MTGKKVAKSVEKYYYRCVEVCWLMNVQDPPVVIDTGTTGGPFNAERFRTYTKTGNTMDYVVWPPLLLHEGGAMLAKGVAQGK